MDQIVNLAMFTMDRTVTQSQEGYLRRDGSGLRDVSGMRSSV